MKVVYFATQDFDEYKEGDLIPAAHGWPARPMYVEQCKIAPVLVGTLPQHAQDALKAWEANMGIEDDGQDIGEVVNEQERVEARAEAARKEADRRAAEQAKAEAEAREARLTAAEVDDTPLSERTNEQLHQYITDLGYIEAKSNDNKATLIKKAENSDALAEGRYEDVTVEVLHGELDRREVEYTSGATKAELVKLLQDNDEAEDGESGDDEAQDDGSEG